MNILYTNGDSWTYGDGVPITTNPDGSTYKATWSWHLSKTLNMHSVNEAEGGSSNDRIFRTTTDYIYKYLGAGKDPAKLTIIIGWSIPVRTEVFVKDSYIKINPHRKFQNEDKLVSDFRACYYKLYDDNASMKKHLSYMLNLRLLCKSLGISYYDFIAFGNHMEEYNALSLKTFNISLENSLYNKTWNHYCCENKTKMYDCGHPAAQTHQDWANRLSKLVKQE